MQFQASIVCCLPNLMKAYGRCTPSTCDPYSRPNSPDSSSRYWKASFLGYLVHCAGFMNGCFCSAHQLHTDWPSGAASLCQAAGEEMVMRPSHAGHGAHTLSPSVSGRRRLSPVCSGKRTSQTQLSFLVAGLLAVVQIS